MPFGVVLYTLAKTIFVPELLKRKRLRYILQFAGKRKTILTASPDGSGILCFFSIKAKIERTAGLCLQKSQIFLLQKRTKLRMNLFILNRFILIPLNLFFTKTVTLHKKGRLSLKRLLATCHINNYISKNW